MKNQAITYSALLMSFSLVGCNTMNSASQYSNSTVGTGVHYGATAVGTGVGYVADTGAFIGNSVGKVVGTGVGVVGSGVGMVTGQPARYQNASTYQNNKVIYHNGHHYVMKNGKYVLVH